MTVKSGNWMGSLHKKLQSESQWKDSGRQQYLKRRKIKRRHEVWEGAFRRMEKLRESWEPRQQKIWERGQKCQMLWDLFQFNSFPFFSFFPFKNIERLPLTFQGSRIGIMKTPVDRIIHRWLDDLCLQHFLRKVMEEEGRLRQVESKWKIRRWSSPDVTFLRLLM